MKAMQDCTHHAVHPGPAWLPHRNQEQKETGKPAVHGTVPVTEPLGWGTPMRGRSITATMRRSPPQHSTPRREDVRSTKQVQPEQHRGGPARGVHNPKTRLLGPPYPGEAGHSTPEGGDGSPKSTVPINPPAPAGGAKETYIGRLSANITFRNVINWGSVQRAR